MLKLRKIIVLKQLLFTFGKTIIYLKNLNMNNKYVKQASKQASKQANKQANKQTSKQANITKHEWFIDDLIMTHFGMCFEPQPKETMFPHAYDYHQILVFEEGGGMHLLDNETHFIRDFSIHFMPTGTVHFLRDCKPYYRLLFNKDR